MLMRLIHSTSAYSRRERCSSFSRPPSDRQTANTIPPLDPLPAIPHNLLILRLQRWSHLDKALILRLQLRCHINQSLLLHPQRPCLLDKALILRFQRWSHLDKALILRLQTRLLHPKGQPPTSSCRSLCPSPQISAFPVSRALTTESRSSVFGWASSTNASAAACGRGLFPVKASSARLIQLQHFLWQVLCFDLLVMPTLTPYHASATGEWGCGALALARSYTRRRHQSPGEG